METLFYMTIPIEHIGEKPAGQANQGRTIGDARYVEFAGVGHLPCIEAPQLLAAEIAHFMKETGLD